MAIERPEGFPLAKWERPCVSCSHPWWLHQIRSEACNSFAFPGDFAAFKTFKRWPWSEWTLILATPAPWSEEPGDAIEYDPSHLSVVERHPGVAAFERELLGMETK